MSRFTFLLQAASRVRRGAVVELDLICQRRLNAEPFGAPVVYKLRPMITERDGTWAVYGSWSLTDTDGRTELGRWVNLPMSQITLFAYDCARQREMEVQRKANEVLA